MERDPGDVVDRYTIAMLKGERGAPFEEEVWKLKKKYPKIPWKRLVGDLYEVNKIIWSYESQVGKLALRIRRVNSLRVEFRNLINKLTGNITRETKIDHASAKECL